MTPKTSTSTVPTQAQWDAANRFLEELLTNNTLAQGYLNIAQQANGQENAPAMLTNWLKQQGYDTTPALIYGALVAVQNTALGYWLGIYGQSYQQTGSTDAPVLCILPDINGNITPYLNGVALVNYTFKSVESDGSFNPILSWGLESNSTAGEITFYYTPEVNTAPNPPTGYTGNWFQGTLQTGANAPQQSFFGALGSASAEALPTLSLSEQETEQQQSESWWKKTIAWLNAHPVAWFGVGVAGLVVAVGLIYGGYKLVLWTYKSIQKCLQEREQARQEMENDLLNHQEEEFNEQAVEQWYGRKDKQKQEQESSEIIQEEKQESDAEIESLEQGIRQEVGNKQRQLENQPPERYPNVFDNPRMTLKDVEKTRVFPHQKPELKNLDSVRNFQNPDAYIHQGESGSQGIQNSGKFGINEEEPLLQSLILSELSGEQNIDPVQHMEDSPSYPQRVLDLPIKSQWHRLNPEYKRELQENLGKRLNRLGSFGENLQPPSQFDPKNLDHDDLNASQNLGENLQPPSQFEPNNFEGDDLSSSQFFPSQSSEPQKPVIKQQSGNPEASKLNPSNQKNQVQAPPSDQQIKTVKNQPSNSKNTDIDDSNEPNIRPTEEV